jgi:hypothetical protein
MLIMSPPFEVELLGHPSSPHRARLVLIVVVVAGALCWCLDRGQPPARGPEQAGRVSAQTSSLDRVAAGGPGMGAPGLGPRGLRSSLGFFNRRVRAEIAAKADVTAVQPVVARPDAGGKET